MITANREKLNRRFDRILRWSREKRARFMRKYDNWLLFRLNKYGTGEQITHEEFDANRRLQLAIRKENQNES